MKFPPFPLVRSVRLVAAALLFLALSARAEVSVTTLARLGGDPDGYHAEAALIDGGDGFFYGTTEAGGPANLGTIFKVAPDGTLTTLYLFTGGSDGANPTAALVAGGDGNFYGTTPGSSLLGLGSAGTVFRVTPAGVLTTLHTFGALDSTYHNADGAQPEAELILGSDGNLYGVTGSGGPKGGGTVFRLTLAGVLTTLVNFDGSTLPNVFGPTTALVQGADGNFYGETEYGGAGPDITGDGAIYRVTSDGTLTTIYSFTNGADGSAPINGLVRGADGNFYGTTQTTLFQVTSAGALTTLHTFDTNNEGVGPLSLMAGTDGNLYGATSNRGLQGYGTIYKATTAGAITVLYSFTENNAVGFGANKLVRGSDGNFYGTTQSNAKGYGGAAFQLTPAGALAVLHAFNPGGSASTTPLVVSPEGYLYGSTTRGGATGGGTIFGVTLDGNLTTELAFDDETSGSFPGAGMVTDGAGNYYGLCELGGPDGGWGTFFTLSEDTSDVTGAAGLVPLDNGDVRHEVRKLLVDAVFPQKPKKSSRARQENRPYALKDPETGAFERLIYGTPYDPNNASEAGAIVNALFNPNTNIVHTQAAVGTGSAPTESDLYSFPADGSKGSFPLGGLLVDGAGNVYGTTALGGAAGSGTVYQLTPAGVLNTLYSFQGNGDGAYPAAGLTLGSDGNFYGTTEYATYDANTAESTGNGTIFQLTPAGVLTTLHTFSGSDSYNAPEGAQPTAELIQASDGKFYGVTSMGGSFPAGVPVYGGHTTQGGTVFSITPDGTFTTVYSFGTTPGDGTAPMAPLIAGSDGNLYGTTSAGGTDGSGSVFKVDLNATTTPAGAPVITSTLNVSAQVGLAFAYPITATNTPTSFAATGLPGGLSVDPATGIISGTPTVAGTFTVGLSATNASGTGMASLALTVAAAPVVVPVVTVMTAGDGEAVEGGENGKVAIRRDGDMTNPLVVRYKVVGGAVGGKDYKMLTGTATIPAGAAQVKVKIKPVNDTAHEGTRIAKLKLKAAADSSYVLGATKAAKVKIIDND